MKIDLITLHTSSNYGSCLQAYATQSLFESLGFKVEIIDYYRKNNLLENQVERTIDHKLSSVGALWKNVPAIKGVLAVPVRYALAKRRHPFDLFRLEYLHFTPQTYDSVEALKADPPLADVYCTGSDQVWNSIWNEGFEEAYYLTFAPEGKKRIAFSASIGRDNIDDWEKPLMKSALSKYNAISMREMSGVRILRELGFSKTELVLDPTLMLAKSSWAKLATFTTALPNNYVLIYQLNDDPELVAFAHSLSERFGLKIVKLSYVKSQAISGAINVIAPSVTDFVGIFLNAAYVVTDSFHATAYSLNFGIPFTVVTPSRFSTRILSILRLTETEERILKNVGDIDMFTEPIDFHRAQSRIEEMRGKSIEFLEDALS